MRNIIDAMTLLYVPQQAFGSESVASDSDAPMGLGLPIEFALEQ
jgi:hypothetical protein